MSQAGVHPRERLEGPGRDRGGELLAAAAQPPAAAAPAGVGAAGAPGPAGLQRPQAGPLRPPGAAGRPAGGAPAGAADPGPQGLRVGPTGWSRPPGGRGQLGSRGRQLQGATDSSSFARVSNDRHFHYLNILLKISSDIFSGFYVVIDTYVIVTIYFRSALFSD